MKNGQMTNADAMHHETIVLGSMISDNSQIPHARQRISTRFFRFPKNRIIFKAILEMHKAYKSVDVVSLLSYLTDENRLEDAGGAEWVADIMGRVDVAQKAFKAARERKL